MKTILKVLSAVALSGAMVLPVLADDTTSTDTDAKDQKDLKKVIEDQGINYVETAQKGITLSGYVDVSYTEQFGGRGTGFGGAQSNLHEFDRNNNNFNVNAVKIALEKALPDKNDWAAGFRIDAILGSDAKYLGDAAFNGSSSSGTNGNTSGVALEQALVKFRIPVGNGLDIYAGKFVTFLGYEVIESPANPNFSRGLLFTNLIPLTHTGVYADYKFNDTVEAKFGIVDGWNNSVSTPAPNGSTDAANNYPFGGKAITGQLTINAPGKNANITQSFIYSPSGENAGAPQENGTVVVYDIWGNWSPTFVKDSALTLGFNLDFGWNSADGFPAFVQPTSGVIGDVGTTTAVNNNGALGGGETWWGGALYAQYKVNKVLTLAVRGEYIHSSSAWNPLFGATGLTDTAGNSLATPAQDDFSETLTASFNIWDNLLTRIEYRCDVLSAGSGGTHQQTVASGGTTTTVTALNGSSVQNEVSLEAVYSF
ncbi:MAG: porin [Methylacidiphilales bacterium]|nr:porin [Candidatus Methylacidiphilales bacterium]